MNNLCVPVVPVDYCNSSMDGISGGLYNNARQSGLSNNMTFSNPLQCSQNVFPAYRHAVGWSQSEVSNQWCYIMETTDFWTEVYYKPYRETHKSCVFGKKKRIELVLEKLA